MADPTLDEMMSDLAAADAAGDTELAQHIAGRIKSASVPNVGMGDVQAAPSAQPGPELPPLPGAAESLGRGAVQGLTAGFGDEIKGARAVTARHPYLSAALRGTPASFLVGEPGVEDKQSYEQARDAERAKNEAARKEHGGLYLGGEVGASLLPALLTGGSSAAATGGARVLPAALRLGAQGAAQGAGYSNADTARGLVSDSALGGALGLVGGAAGKGLGKAFDWAARKGAGVVSRASGRAAQQAAEESSAAVRSVEGAARERAANAYRQMERIQLSLQDPALPKAERTALETFKQSPEYAALLAANAKGILSAAPDALAEREAASAVAQGERAALPEAIRSRTAELLTPQKWADTKSFLKSYAEPLAWGFAAQQGANAMGLDPKTQAILGVVAGSIGGRTRAGKALWNRLSRPGNAASFGRAMETSAGAVGAGVRGATELAPAAAALGVTSNEGQDKIAALIAALRRNGRPGPTSAAGDEENP